MLLVTFFSPPFIFFSFFVVVLFALSLSLFQFNRFIFGGGDLFSFWLSLLRFLFYF